MVNIDMEGIQHRILALDVPRRNYVGLMPAPEGQVFYAESAPNQNGVTLHKYNLKERKADVFMASIQNGTVSHDRKQLLYRNGGSWGIVGTAGKPKPGDGKLTINGGALVQLSAPYAPGVDV